MTPSHPDVEESHRIEATTQNMTEKLLLLAVKRDVGVENSVLLFYFMSAQTSTGFVRVAPFFFTVNPWHQKEAQRRLQEV